MSKDVDDIKKLDDIIKTEDQICSEDEYNDLLNYSISDDDEQLEDFESDSSNSDVEEVNIEQLDDSANAPFVVTETNFQNDFNTIKYYLTGEEINAIMTCDDPKLKRLLILNRARHVHLKAVRHKLLEALKEFNVLIKQTEEKIKTFSSNSSKACLKSIVPRLGYPYFKTKSGVSCPPNVDMIRKEERNEISLDYLPLVARWTIEDQVILKRSVLFYYANSCIDNLEMKRKALKEEKKTAIDDDELRSAIIKDIIKTQNEIDRLKDMDNVEPPPLCCDADINWKQISENDLMGRHSEHSCRAFWNISVHPSINKSKWTNKENEQILALAKKHRYQNWDAIAMELDNNRTGFAVCVHYYTTLSNKFRKDRWDDEEDEYLMEIVEFCRIGNYIPWTRVAHYFGTRAKCQIYHRYKYSLSYNSMKKGTFSEAEDVLLLCLIYKFGPDYTKIVKYIPERSPGQLSHRYTNYLRFKDIRLGQWTPYEDKLIINHVHNYGEKNWSKLATLIPGRNRTHVRQRFVIIKKWMESNPGKSIDDIIRSTTIYKHHIGLKLVRETADYFHKLNKIPTIEEIEKKLNLAQPRHLKKMKKKNKNNLVDMELIAFFKNTCKIKTSKVFNDNSLEQLVSLVNVLLRTLDVHLEYSDFSLCNEQGLDDLDKEILTQLMDSPNVSFPSSSNFKTQDKTIQVTKLIPPNINTLIGFRSMLIMHNSYKSQILKTTDRNTFTQAKAQITDVIEQELISFDVATRTQVLKQRETFEERFNKLFKWPAIMSIMEPEDDLNLLGTKAVVKARVLTPKIGRPKKDLKKIHLMNEARKKRRLALKPATEEALSNTSLESHGVEDPKNKPVNLYVQTIKTNDINSLVRRLEAGNLKVTVKKVEKQAPLLPTHCVFLKEQATGSDSEDEDAPPLEDTVEPQTSRMKETANKRNNIDDLTNDAKKIKCEDDISDINKLNKALLAEKKIPGNLFHD